MKSLLFIMSFVVLSSAALAQQRLPINLPLQISAKISGAFEVSSSYGRPDTLNRVDSLYFDIDTSRSQYYCSADSLYVRMRNPDVYDGYDIVEMKFDTVAGSLSLSLTRHVYQPSGSGYQLESTYNFDCSITCGEVRYSRDSIFADQTFSTPEARVTDADDYWVKIGGTDDMSRFLHGNVTISGSTLATSGVGGASTIPASLSILFANGSPMCHFTATAHPRSLEVYSTIGTKVASINVPSGVQEIGLPRLQAGFYFLRLGDEIARIYLAP